MRHVRNLLFAPVVLLVLSWVGAAPAGADCSGPTITYGAGEVRAGGTVTVEGNAWGYECYDTGPPPAGEGVLGEPVVGIEVVLSQDGFDEVVARGAAGDDYDFVVEVTVPGWFQPGEATVSARYAGGVAYDATDRPLIVLDEPALETTGEIVSFGPVDERPPPTSTSTTGPTTSTTTSEDGGGAAAPARDGGGGISRVFLLLAGLGIGAAVVAMVVFLRPSTSVTHDT